ncbi:MULTISPECIES: YjfB family protein [Undibacterium]|uniref:Putative motility protein n=1 Tax=Undibacterium parvum TaxID=401471 RepID=A0A3Q9BNR3_9BURK|nr:MULTISPECIES: YjfB family protein [Undibacterium]AZP11038.1 putative motility protein [Undibacterium parvum]
MDVNGIANVASTLADVGTSQAVSLAVLKKAIDFGTESATALIEAIPPAPTTPNLPAHLGQNINTSA